MLPPASVTVALFSANKPSLPPAAVVWIVVSVAVMLEPAPVALSAGAPEPVVLINDPEEIVMLPLLAARAPSAPPLVSGNGLELKIMPLFGV